MSPPTGLSLHDSPQPGGENVETCRNAQFARSRRSGLSELANASSHVPPASLVKLTPTHRLYSESPVLQSSFARHASKLAQQRAAMHWLQGSGALREQAPPPPLPP